MQALNKQYDVHRTRYKNRINDHYPEDDGQEIAIALYPEYQKNLSKAWPINARPELKDCRCRTA